MNVTQTDALAHDSSYSALAARQEPLLKGAIDLDTAEGTWDLGKDDRGRPLLVLRLRDAFNGECTAAFAPDEMGNDSHLASRFRDLKGALLRVGQWRGQLQALFATVRPWCLGLTGAHVREEPMCLSEERSGTYEASRLLVTSNGRTMRVQPVAAWVVGAEGRVDLKGVGESFTLVYSRDRGGGWRSTTVSPPRCSP
jgi:hypothetical protein